MKKTLGYIFLESFLIGFSVLAAFWLENYREEREVEKTKFEYYKRIKSDLRSDSINWNNIRISINIQTGRIARLSKMLVLPTTNLTEITAELFRFENEMLYYDIYTFPDLSFTIKTIINSERGDIFESDSSFFEIQRYYAKRDLFIEDIKAYEAYNTNYITPYMDKYFDRSCIKFKPEGRFKLEFLTVPNYRLSDFLNREFTNYLINAGNHLIPEVYADEMIKYCNDMIKLLDKRIKGDSG